MGARTNEGHSEKTAQRTRTRAGTRPSTLAKRLLRGTGAILLSHSPRASDPISQENPLTGKPDARNGPVRFGGRGEVQTLVPTPIHFSTAWIRLSRRLKPPQLCPCRATGGA